jgi:hypothetical protein
MTRPASWNGVVQTPLRKLWVQCQRVATSLNKVLDSSAGYPRAPFAHCRHPASRGPPLRQLPPRDSSPRTLGNPPGYVGPGPRDCSGTGWSGSPPGRGSGDPLRDPPKKGGPGPPQKGGCRDTKQCKFWRVSSVLIQGLFCFLGVRGGLRGGPPGGRFWGVSGVGPSAREPGDTPPVVRPGRNPPSTRGPWT